MRNDFVKILVVIGTILSLNDSLVVLTRARWLEVFWPKSYPISLVVEQHILCRLTLIVYNYKRSYFFIHKKFHAFYLSCLLISKMLYSIDKFVEFAGMIILNHHQILCLIGMYEEWFIFSNFMKKHELSLFYVNTQR